MYQFFTEPNLISGGRIVLEGDNYNHIKNVLRLRVGDVISVFDGVSADEYRCHITEFAEKQNTIVINVV